MPAPPDVPPPDPDPPPTVAPVEPAAVRTAAHRHRTVSEWLCARADTERTRAETLRVITDGQRAGWQLWHLVWQRLWNPSAPGEPPAGHPLIRICMYCGRVHLAAPPTVAARPADAAWVTVPWYVRDQLRLGTTGLRVSHGLCPACAYAHGLLDADEAGVAVPVSEGAAPVARGPVPSFLPQPDDMSADVPAPHTGPPRATPDHQDVLSASAFARERSRVVGGALRRTAAALTTPEERAVHIVERLLTEFGADLAAAAQIAREGTALEVIGATEADAERLLGEHAVSTDAGWPAGEAVRLGRVVHCSRREGLLAAFPQMAGVVERLGIQALAAVPSYHLGHANGAIVLAWRSPRTLSAVERSLLRATSGRLARALAHAHLYYAERAAHAAAEEARRAEGEARAEADRQRAVAVRANEAKDEFLAVVSHELRTPLQAVLGFSELMGAGLAGPLTDKQRDYVGRIQAAGGQLLDTIENLLGFARAQAGKEVADAAPFDAAAVVAHVLAMAAPLAERKRLALWQTGCDAPVPVTGDERKFRQVVTNLVANAVKFTPAGEVEAGVALDGDVLRLTVRDTGVGIPAGQLERVFEPFVQAAHAAGPTTRPAGGTGLGLSIVRSLARLLRGDVRVESAVGRGSTFVVELPRVLAPER